MTSPDELIAKLRELHGPVSDRKVSAWQVCQGCDMEGYETEEPCWPCTTAELLFTPEEIKAEKERFKAEFVARSERRR